MKSHSPHSKMDITQFCPKCGYDLAGLEGSICPECGSHFDRSELKFISRSAIRSLSATQTILIVIGTAWAILAWMYWPFAPHRSYLTAAIGGILLAPSYILLSVAPGRAHPMRAFVITAMVILIAVTTKLRGYDLVGLYLLAPPAAALITFILRIGIFR